METANLRWESFRQVLAPYSHSYCFLPSDMDVTPLTPVLTTILKEGLVEAGSNLHDRRRNLMAISNELNEVFFRYPFRQVTVCAKHDGVCS